MKKFIQTILGLSKDLMGKIEKDQLNITSANGIVMSENNGISYEEAKVVTANYTAYKKESAQFKTDETKIIVPKKVFFNILKANISNLFLIKDLNHHQETRLKFSSEVKDAAARPPKVSYLFLLYGSFIIFLTLGIIKICFPHSFWNGGVLYDPSLKPAGHGIILLVLSLVPIVVICSGNSLLTRTRILKAKKRFSQLGDDHLFSSGMSESFSEYFQKPNTVFNFSKIAGHFPIVSKAVGLGGDIGYLILKNQGTVKVIQKNGMVKIWHTSNVIPVILLKETVIFDVSLIAEVSEEKTLTYPFYCYAQLSKLFENVEFKLFL